MEERTKKIIFSLVVAGAVVVMATRADSGVKITTGIVNDSNTSVEAESEMELVLNETEAQTEPDSETESETDTEPTSEDETELTSEEESETGRRTTVAAKTSGTTLAARRTTESESETETESETELSEDLTAEEELAREKIYDTAQTAYAVDNINIRVEPGTDESVSVFDSFYKGEKIVVLGETPNWYVVQVDGFEQKGYVSKEFISEQKVTS